MPDTSVQEIMRLLKQGAIDPKHTYLKPYQVTELGNGTPKPSTLAMWRSADRNDLKPTRIGRYIRYRLSDVLAFLGGE